jgi:mono/diheme cytochrome c family protein
MRTSATALVILALAGAAACDRAPDATGEWSPQDHDPPEQQQGQQGQQARPQSSAEVARQLAMTAWSQTCARCHGPMGHGDGPEGPMVKAPDLTRADWQAKVTDQEIAERIRAGKGLMPPNDLPDSTLRALVGLVRAMGRATGGQ